MEPVLEYMKNREWTKDYKAERKIYLINLAKNGMNNNDISSKIGSILIYNQIIEQLLKEIIICSIAYVKAEIWPSEVSLGIELDKVTFGILIEKFKQFAIKMDNREVILKYLSDLNKKRNIVVHRLFDIKNINGMRNQLNEFGDLSYEAIMLLNEYYDQLSWYLYDLDERVDFSAFDD